MPLPDVKPERKKGVTLRLSGPDNTGGKSLFW